MKKAIATPTCPVENIPQFSERLAWLISQGGRGCQARITRKTGIGQSTLRYYKTGRILPSLPVAVTLAKYFGVSLDYLAGLDDDERRKTK